MRARQLSLASVIALAISCAGPTDVDPGPKTSPPGPSDVASDKPRPYDGEPAKSPDGLVETRRATPLGPTGFTPNGAINPKGRPTKYWFEYGPTTAYGSKTPERALPGKLAAHFKEDWNVDSANWASGLAGTDLAYVPANGSTTG